MTRRRLWGVCMVFATLCLLLINLQSNKETVVVQVAAPRKSDSNVPIAIEKEDGKAEEEEKNEIQSPLSENTEMKHNQEGVTDGLESTQPQTGPENADNKNATLKVEKISFRGDINTPKVNGHSISFTDVNSRTAPEKIRIHFIWHSHVDPGWQKTFEEYYKEKVNDIISNAVKSLSINKDLRFIWSETSFLERWWRDASLEQKKQISELIRTGQLEISGGAWVMTDEATPTFYAAIENMIEGHKFIHENFNITPKTSWSVDPFGHGAMMPELLHRAGVEAMVIGRFHDHIKEKLRKKQALRWKWIPPYFEKLEGPKVNSLPHLVYTTEDACENHEVCLCYHVGASALWQARCPGQSVLHNMNDSTVEFMTKRLVDEMRKTQLKYGAEDILVPIGDDFYFGNYTDWELMYTGYSKMINWLKEHPEVNAEMKFSTVQEFFDAVKNEETVTLRGDFFPYTSNMNNPNPWWTGYFVHRPFTKTMERRLQNHLRALDIASVLSSTPQNLSLITFAKQQLTLFQHHDGITGTSRDYVMRDYETRMKFAFEAFVNLFQQTVFGKSGILSYNGGNNSYTVLTVPKTGKLNLYVFSSQTYSYKTLLKIVTDGPVSVETAEGKKIPSQSRKIKGNYHVEFFGDLAPLSISQFAVVSEEKKDVADTSKKCWKVNEDTGEIQALLLGNETFPFNISFSEVLDNGGAYVIEAYGTTKKISSNTSHDYSSIFQSVEYTDFPSKRMKMRVKCLGEGDISVEINTDVHMASTLTMSVATKIKQDPFYTDVNGLYHLKRKYEMTFNDRIIPTEANIFPVATSVFVQDEHHRLTVATGQPTGATVSNTGTLEILVDRHVVNDDGKGLAFDECLDNRSSIARYRILLEKRVQVDTSTSTHSFLSLRAERAVFETLYPPIIVASTEALASNLKPPPTKWPCAIQLVSWRPLTDKIAILILRKYNVDATIDEEPCNENSLKDLYNYFSTTYKSIYHTKLSATEDEDKASLESFQRSLSAPFSIASFRLHS